MKKSNITAKNGDEQQILESTVSAPHFVDNLFLHQYDRLIHADGEEIVGAGTTSCYYSSSARRIKK